ncbi:MAG: CoA transferase [Hyphomicrobiales bacterium]
MHALEGVTVVETGSDLAVAFAGRLLRGLGAHVRSAVEPGAQVDQLLVEYLQAGKEPIAANAVPGALGGAQVWLEGSPGAGASHDGALVHVVLTPWGSEGPWAGKPGSAFTGAALGGMLHLCGDEQGAPLKNGGLVLEFQAGLFMVLGAIAGLLRLEAGDGGSRIETSYLESANGFQERGDIAWTHLHQDWRRTRRHEVGHPFTIFPCADGYVTIAVGTPRHWANLCVLMGKPEWGSDMELLMNRLANADLIDSALVPWLKSLPASEVVRQCQEMFIPCGPVLTASQVLHDAHLAERKFWRTFGAAGREWTVPGPPFRMEGAWDEAAWQGAAR